MATPTTQPHPLLDPFLPACSAWALVAAADAGVFEALAAGERSASELAAERRLDPGGLERLLPVLVRLGYLEVLKGRYRLAPVSREHLLPDSPRPLIHWMRFCRHQLLAMAHLPARLAGGKAIDLYELMESPEELRTHQLAMAETASPVADWVADQVPIPEGGEWLLDVGGSHGVYAAAICRRHPPLRAEVLELPAIVTAARRAAEELGTVEHLVHVAGDVRTVELTRSYAAVFLGNLVHHMSREELPALFEKVARQLVPRGVVAIWDIEEAASAQDLPGSLFSLFFHLTSAARCYARGEIADLLAAAGFGGFEVRRPNGASLHTLLVAYL